jgi:hypothetical protein
MTEMPIPPPAKKIAAEDSSVYPSREFVVNPEAKDGSPLKQKNAHMQKIPNAGRITRPTTRSFCERIDAVKKASRCLY